MKVEKLMKVLKKCLVCTIVCFTSVLYANPNNTEISSNEEEWEQENEKGTRDVAKSTFTIQLNNGILTIHNSNPIFDLDITIINNATGEEVYHTQVNKEASNYIVLPISALGAGQYRLTISNPTAGYAFAYFNL